VIAVARDGKPIGLNVSLYLKNCNIFTFIFWFSIIE